MADDQNLSNIAPLKRSRSDLEAYESSESQQGGGIDIDNDNCGVKRSRNGPEGDVSGMNCDMYHYTNGSHQNGETSEYSLHGQMSMTHAYNSLDQPCKSNDRPHKSHHLEHHHHEKANHKHHTHHPPETEAPERIEPAEEHMNDDNEDNDDDEDSLSDISDLSGISIEGWRPTAGPIAWVQQQIEANTDPRTVLQQLLPDTIIPAGVDDVMLWKVVINILSEPPKRKKLPHINNIEHVIDLLRKSKKIMVLTGAGVSVSCGIPDFRSKDGIYSRLAVEYPDLPDPQAMFDIHYFRRNPRPFFKFAKEIYPGQFEPSLSHKFISLLEEQGKLLRNYTQNIDTLEQVAGIKNVIQCHGSFTTATCMHCKYRVDSEGIRKDIMNQVIPRCPKCPETEVDAIMKPDIVFFGESLPDKFHKQMEIDKDECDLLIVMGSSLKVRPVALIPNSLPAEVPQVLINREPLKHLNFDVELLGDCDYIVNELCHQLGQVWTKVCQWPGPLTQLTKDQMVTPPISTRPSPMGRMDDTSQMSFQMTGEDSCMSGIQEGEESSTSAHVSLPHFNSDSRGSDSMEPALSAPPSSPNSHHESADSTSQPSYPVKKNPSCTELEELRACWQPRIFNLAKRLQEGTFLYLPPSRYIFKGAEVYDEDDDTDDEASSQASEDAADVADVNDVSDVADTTETANKAPTSNDDSDDLVPPDLDTMLPFYDLPTPSELSDLPSSTMNSDIF